MSLSSGISTVVLTYFCIIFFYGVLWTAIGVTSPECNLDINTLLDGFLFSLEYVIFGEIAYIFFVLIFICNVGLWRPSGTVPQAVTSSSADVIRPHLPFFWKYAQNFSLIHALSECSMFA